MPKIIHNGVEYGGGGYSKKQIDDKLRLKLDKSSVDAVLSSDSVKPVQNKVVTKALIDKVSQVKVMPTSDFDGVAVLYTGDTTTEYTQGHVYQYSETDSSWIDITDVLDVIKNVESLPTANIEDMFYRIGGGEWITKTVTLSPDPDDTIEQLEAIGYTVLSDHYQESTNTRDVSFKGDNNHFGYVSHSNLYRIKTINATWSLSSGRYAVDGTGNDGHVSIVVLSSERKEDANFRVLAQNELWAGDSETQTIRRVAWDDEVTIQYETMPTPSENELGKIVQYVGETTGSYIKGFFYRCVSIPDTDPTQYEWVHQNVDDGSGDAVVWVTDFPTAPDIKNVVYGKITTTTEYTNEKTVGLDSLDTETRITLDGDNYIPASTDDVYVKGGDVSDYEVFVSFNTVTNELTTNEGTHTLETETELTFATQTTTETKSFRIGNEDEQTLSALDGSSYTAGYNIKISNENEISENSFVGTTAEYEALSQSEQDSFDEVDLSDDYTQPDTNTGHQIVDENGDGMPQRNNVQFTGGVEVTDDSENDKTVVDVKTYTGGRGIEIDAETYEVAAKEEVKLIYDGTKEEFSALPQEEKIQYDWAAFSDDEVESNVDIYSSDEVKTNKKWFDKPVYRKTIRMSQGLHSTDFTITHAISNLEFVTNIRGMVYNGTLWSPIPSMTGGNFWVSTYADSASIHIRSGADFSSYTFGYIVIEYTKTID